MSGFDVVVVLVKVLFLKGRVVEKVVGVFSEIGVLLLIVFMVVLVVSEIW